MKAAIAEEMRRIDRATIEEYGIPGAVLMERAGLATAAKVNEIFGRKKVFVLAGPGNNGGDGLVAARELFNRGCKVKVLLTSKPDRLSPECLERYKAAKKAGVVVEFGTRIAEGDLHSAVVIDAVFGTGLNKPLSGPFSELIGTLNASGVPVVSVDIPSGISPDTGRVLGAAVRADYTVTFGLPRIGHMLHPGAEYCGRLYVEDIGFPRALLTSDMLKVETVEPAAASALIPERPACSYKGDYGHVLVVAGSRGRTGAAFMTAAACLRAGAGLVTIGVPETLVDVFQTRVTEEMLLPLPDAGNGALAAAALDPILEFTAGKGDVIAIGPGLGVSEDIKKIVDGLVLMSDAPLVIDADAINALAGRALVLKKARSPVVLTPHAGEFAGLLFEPAGLKGKGRVAEIDVVQTALSFAKETGTCLVLKGAPTVTASADGRAFINTTGNPGMATAGSGDVLTGIAAALLGQGLYPVDASVLGVYLHGLAGDIAASARGMHSIIASDIINCIPSAFLSLSKS